MAERDGARLGGRVILVLLTLYAVATIAPDFLRILHPLASAAPLIHRWLLRHPRFQLHFTPTYSSWINQVERWFAQLTEKQIRRGSHRSTRALEHAIRVYLIDHNANPKPFAWVKSADEIIDSIARFALRTSGTGH